MMEPTGMHCPTCRTLLHEKILGEQLVDRCASCAGMWVDEGELAKAVRGLSEFPAVDNQRLPCSDLRCPRCRETLVNQQYAHDSGIWIARCGACRGQWVPGPQLRVLREYLSDSAAIDKLAGTMSEQFQRERYRQIAYEWLTSKWLSGLVAAAYAVVEVISTQELNRIVAVFGFVALPVACIWFPDALGRWTGRAFGVVRPRITHTTPGLMVAVGGWILLLCPALVWLLL